MGASVSFDDCTLGWSELHRFMGVNEQPTTIPAITFTRNDDTVGGCSGRQYVGSAIPAFQTADLATAWETRESGAGGNYAFLYRGINWSNAKAVGSCSSISTTLRYSAGWLIVWDEPCW